MYLAKSWIGIVVVLIGCVSFIARRGRVAMLVFSPVVVAILAALTRQYPLKERLALYLLPLFFVGLAALAESRGPIYRQPLALVGASVVVLLALPMIVGVKVLWHPIDVIDTRGPYEFVDHRFQPGDVVVIENTASATYDYYAKRFDVPRSFLFSYTRYKACGAWTALAPLRPFRRFWIVRTHASGNDVAQQAQVDFDYFGRIGTRGDTFFGKGGSWAAVFDTSSRSTPSDPTTGCVYVRRAPSLVTR